MARSRKWYLSPQLWVEGFATVNLAGLAPDIYLAHSTNYFRHPVEYLPLAFSLVAPLLMLVAIGSWKWSWPALWRNLGHLVGWTSIAIGLAGLILHLESGFFQERTLAKLVYAAPFAAPLSYTGIGLLLVMNRMVDAESMEWPYWVMFLALFGFGGNFVFSVSDHAQNGFFHWTESIPVVSSALAVGFLTVPFLITISRPYLIVCTGILLIQATVGLLGFYFHLSADLHGWSPNLFDNLVYGAPLLAPLLFPNLALLSFIGIWVLGIHLPPTVSPPEPTREFI